jgi:hypothetical protein
VFVSKVRHQNVQIGIGLWWRGAVNTFHGNLLVLWKISKGRKHRAGVMPETHPSF